MEFSGLNCNCVKEDKELSEQFKNILVYTDGEKEIELLGEFKNGDVEVKYTDRPLSYRMARETFDSIYEEVEPVYLIKENALSLQEMESLKTNGAIVPLPSITLSLENLKLMTVQEIKDTFNMNELRTLAKACGMRRVAQTNETKLVEKLLKKAE
jgi:hypothetical protein